LQPGIKVDANATAILERYYKRRRKINEQSFYAGVPPLALLTEPKDDRKATDYTNMDFYYNFGGAAYRPILTIKKLQSHANFVHRRGVLVTTFEENDETVEVKGIDLSKNLSVQFRGNKLVLACNVLGTTRIVLRSLRQFKRKVPVLCNPYTLLPALQPGQLGKIPSFNKTSTAQVCIFLDKDKRQSHVPMASIYSYSSLMLFRLLKKSPLNFRDSLRILKYLQSALIIAGIHHPVAANDSRYAYLDEDGTLQIIFPDAPDEKWQNEITEKRFARVLKQLGCIPLKRITLPHGSSAHYAGTLPFSDENADLSISPDGLLSGTRRIFVADASGFHYLPAKGPTLTIMANAHNVALNILRHEQ
jgi:hypothetical protein